MRVGIHLGRGSGGQESIFAREMGCERRGLSAPPPQSCTESIVAPVRRPSPGGRRRHLPTEGQTQTLPFREFFTEKCAFDK